MQIPSLGNPLSAVFDKPGKVEPLNESLPVQRIEPGKPNGASASPLGEILTDYDLHRISPRQFTEMLDRLKRAEVLTPREHQQLSQLRLEVDSAGVKPDESFDLVDFLAKKLSGLTNQLEQAKRSEDDPQLDSLQATLDLTKAQSKWLDKLMTAKQERPNSGLDAKV